MQIIELNSDAISLLTFENGFQQGFKVKNDIDALANDSTLKKMSLKDGLLCLG